MALLQVLEIMDLLDDSRVDGEAVCRYFRGRFACDIGTQTVQGPKGKTDFVKITVPGTKGRLAGGTARTMGVIGRLGGIGCRPVAVGLVSDADGAVAALSAAAALLHAKAKGDALPGDVIIATHICPDAPTRPHDPVPFMDSPVDILTMNKYEVANAMEAIISIDTTKGNRILNNRGIAMTPTVKEGYILRVSEDLLNIMQTVTGELPRVLPITTQDITPYGNGLFHINSILQPSVATAAPVIGLAVTTQAAVPGCATGASHEQDIALAARFCVEAAKLYGAGGLNFYDSEEYGRITSLYGSLARIQTMGAGR